MKISKLKPGTKLMWDFQDNVLHPEPKHYIYPAIVVQNHYNRPWVLIRTAGSTNWMGPDSESLRLPTEEELKTLEWPAIN